MPTYFAWLTEYPDEGSVIVDAPTEGDALREAVSVLADGDPETQVSLQEMVQGSPEHE